VIRSLAPDQIIQIIQIITRVSPRNTWETLHKIHFGQPGVGMIALGALDIDTLVDILAYTQTLPAE
jgi:hypothetical protein